MRADDLGVVLIVIGGCALVVTPLTLYTVIARLSGIFAIIGFVVLFLGLGIVEGGN